MRSLFHILHKNFSNSKITKTRAIFLSVKNKLTIQNGCYRQHLKQTCVPTFWTFHFKLIPKIFVVKSSSNDKLLNLLRGKIFFYFLSSSTRSYLNFSFQLFHILSDIFLRKLHIIWKKFFCMKYLTKYICKFVKLFFVHSMGVGTKGICLRCLHMGSIWHVISNASPKITRKQMQLSETDQLASPNDTQSVQKTEEQ